MLRDLPPYRGHADDDIVIDVPDVHHEEPQPLQNDMLDDIFGSAPGSPILNGRNGDDETTHERLNGEELSDIPRLRSTHVTNGYREGIADSKEKCIQEGFDEGYSLGAELGLMAGWCLGALEGICKALASQKAGEGASHGGADGESPVMLFERAQEEMMIQKLFGRNYFGADGIWLYEVPGQETETTFREVALAHPVLKTWLATTKDLKRSLCPSGT